MPRSRTSRSSSPQTQRPQETSIFTDRERTFQNVREIFQSSLDEEIIRMVLIECNWRDEIAIDKLLAIAVDAEAQKQYKQKNSQLRKIAEACQNARLCDKDGHLNSKTNISSNIWFDTLQGVLGPISFEEYKTYGSTRSQAIPDSKLSPSEKIIGRPIKDDKSTNYPATQASQDYLVARGTSYNSRPSGGPRFDVNDFPKLPSKSPSPSSALSSERSQSKQAGKQSDKQSKVLLHDADFISEAQSAYNQQYDDAASAQRWEEYKQRISEHYVENLGLENTQGPSETAKLVDKENNISVRSNEFVQSCNLDEETPRSGRSFPVKLLNKEVEEDKLERNRQLLRLDSADLDDTIFKCIYDVPDVPFSEDATGEDDKSGNNLPSVDQVQAVQTPSSLPMTLPVIGLSVEAEEFVPRIKPAVVKNQEPDVADADAVHSPVSTSLDPVSKLNRSTPIEIQPGARNIKHNDSADVSIGSPLQTSPALSPALAQPISPHSTSNPTSLAGSPVFLTYKWPHGLQCVSAAPTHHSQILTTSPRYIPAPPSQPHLPPTAFRLHTGPPAMSFPKRVVYPLAPPHFFRMAAGIRHQQMQPMRPPPVPVPRLPTDIDERASFATGQSLITPADIKKKATDNVKGNKLINPTWINECQQKIVDHHKDGKKVLVIVRGLPGSGKSFLSRKIKMDGSVLSTDDYFMKGNYYTYNHDKLAESHKWNRERAREAMKIGKSPIIIDNTNTQKWEFKAYVSMALSNNYLVEILEPETPWKFKPNELAKRNVHGVPKDQIQRMLNRYEHNITVESIFGKTSPANEGTMKSGKDKQKEETAYHNEEEKREEANESNNNRMWDINERKAAHLSRHLTPSPVSNSSRGSSIERQPAAGTPHPSLVPDQGSGRKSPTVTNEKDKAHIINVQDSQFDEQNITYTVNENKSSQASNTFYTNLNAPPPSIKFDKPINRNERRVKMKDSDENNASSIRKPMNLEENESKITEISSKLSPETLKEIEEMLEAHIKDAHLSQDMLLKREEELGALLQLLPIDVEEIIAAERFIHLKLKSCSIDQENSSRLIHDVKTDNEMEFHNDSDLVSQDIISKTHLSGLESDNSTHQSFISDMSGGNEKEVGSNAERGCIEIVSSLDNTGTEIEAIKTVKENSDKNSSTEKEDPLLKEDGNKQNLNVTENTTDILEVDENVAGTKASDIEMQYWNKVDKDIVNSTVSIESKWGETNEVAEKWEEESSPEDIPSQNELIKPQRSKKSRHSSLSSWKVGVANTNNEIENLENIKSDENQSECKVQDGLEKNEAYENDGNKTRKLERLYTEVDQKEDLVKVTAQQKSAESICSVGVIENKELSNGDIVIDVKNCGQLEQQTAFSSDGDISKDKVHDCLIAISNNEVASVHSTALEMLKEVYSDGENLEEQQTAEKCVISDHVEAIHNCSFTNTHKNYFDESNKNENNSTNITNSITVLNNNNVNIDSLSCKSTDVTTQSASSEISNKSGQKEKSKKKSNRKIAAKFPEPLISREDKEKFLSRDWTSLSVTPTPSGNANDSHTAQTHNLLNLTDSVTMTTDQDFRDVDILNKGAYVDSTLKYLIGSSKKIIVNSDHDLKSSESSVINKVHLVHKSTCTDDLKDMSYSEGVKFLKTCFPNVQEDELECVLVNCNDNVEWAINLLLDWKYSLHLTDEEKEKFVSGMGELQLANKPTKQPSSLTDLCFQLIEEQKIASREEIEHQLIETSKERLERIEDDNINKIRLQRSSSLNESTEDGKDGSFTSKLSPRGVNRSQSVSSQQDKSPLSILNESLEDQEKQIKKELITTETAPGDTVPSSSDTFDNIKVSTADIISYSSDINNDIAVSSTFIELQNENIIRDRKMEKIKRKVEMKEFVGLKDDDNNANEDDLQPTFDGMNDSSDMGASAVTISLSNDVVRQLEKMFGPLGASRDVASLPVPLDHTTALRLYQCIKHGLVSYTRTQLQLREDAEMARRLQDEEDLFVSSQQSQPNERSRKYVPLSQNSHRPQHPPIKSLESIMKEEEAEERKKQEFQKMLEYEGSPSSMSTRVKRLQLYDKYPSVDRPVIDRLFEANCFNMSETEEVIKWSLGHLPGTPKTEASDLDKSLIESTKQQSMQEMLDSYIYTPQVKKDYQDGADPEYEDYRGEANLHYRLRHECFQKAQAAFRQGLKQVASFYSQQGHLHTRKIKEANMRASEQILADRNADLVKNGTLDLHGLHIDEAIAALNRILPDLQQDYNKKFITIITGRGSHSKGGIARLRPSVIAYLKRFHFTFSEEQTGVIRVNLKHRRADK